MRRVSVVGAWAGTWFVGALTIALMVWLAYFVVEVSRRLGVWPF